MPVLWLLSIHEWRILTFVDIQISRAGIVLELSFLLEYPTDKIDVPYLSIFICVMNAFMGNVHREWQLLKFIELIQYQRQKYWKFVRARACVIDKITIKTFF